MTDRASTPPQLGKRWGIKPERVIAMIRSGELRGFDISKTPGVGRPRYRVTPDAIIEFEQKRSGAVTRRATRRRKTQDNVIQFF